MLGGVHAQGCMACNPRAGGSVFCCGFHPFIAPGPAHGAACKEPLGQPQPGSLRGGPREREGGRRGRRASRQGEGLPGQLGVTGPLQPKGYRETLLWLLQGKPFAFILVAPESQSGFGWAGEGDCGEGEGKELCSVPALVSLCCLGACRGGRDRQQ